MTRLPRIPSLSPGPLVAAIALGLGLLLAGCDSSSNAVDEPLTLTGEAAVFEEALVTLSEGGDLSADETESLRDLIASYAAEADEPGTLWLLAADVHEELTDEQIDRLKGWVADRREQMQERGRFGPPDQHGPRLRGAPPHWLRELDLTDAQKEELRAIRATYRNSLQTLREECRNGTLDETDLERGRALLEEMRATMRDVLTEDQLAQLEARREAIRAARAGALDLTEEQQAHFDSLHAARDGFGGPPMRLCRRGDDGPAPGEDPLASILTEEQREIVMIHRILRHHVIKERMGPPRGR